MLTIFASDGAAYRVKTSKEILIEARRRALPPERAAALSAAGEKVEFSYASEQPTPLAEQLPVDPPGGPRHRQRSGRRRPLRADLRAPRYLFRGAARRQGPAPWRHRPLGERRGREVGAGHRRGGVRQARVPHRRGSLRTDHLPEPVEDALLSLERDKVEATAPLSKGADWLRLEKLNPTQYRVWIPVREEFSPNLTFSVLYTKGGDYSPERRDQGRHAPGRDRHRHRQGALRTGRDGDRDPGHALRRQTGFQPPDRQRGG